MSGSAFASLNLESPRATRRRVLQGLGALTATPWIVRAAAAEKVAPLALPLHLTQMVNHIGMSVPNVTRAATFYSHLFDGSHVLGMTKPALRYVISFYPGALSIGPLATSGAGAHAHPFIDHFAVFARPFNLADWRARLIEQKLPFFAGGSFVKVNGVNVQILGGHEGPPHPHARKGPAGAGFKPMPPLYRGAPLLKAHGFKRVVVRFADLDAASETFRTLFGLPAQRTDSGNVFFHVGSIQLELQDAPSGPSGIAAFGIKVAPFDREKVSRAIEALGGTVPSAHGHAGARFARRAAPLTSNAAVLTFHDPFGIPCELWPT